MHTTSLLKLGGSVMPTVPAPLPDLLELRPGAQVVVDIKDCRPVVEPRTRPVYSLEGFWHDATRPPKTALGSTPILPAKSCRDRPGVAWVPAGGLNRRSLCSMHGNGDAPEIASALSADVDISARRRRYWRTPSASCRTRHSSTTQACTSPVLAFRVPCRPHRARR